MMQKKQYSQKLNVCEGLDVMIDDRRSHHVGKHNQGPSFGKREEFLRMPDPGTLWGDSEDLPYVPHFFIIYFCFSLFFTLKNVQFAICSEFLEHSSTFQITNNCQSQWQKKKYASRTVEDWILHVSWHGSLNAVTMW